MEACGQGDIPDARPGRRGLPVAAAAAVIALAAVVGCTKVWNYDVFWHLAGGQWMLRHHRVLGHDPFSVPDAPGAAPAEWVNVHWGFQLIVAGAHAVGGFRALVVLKMAVFAATMAVLALWLRRRVPPAWLLAVGAWLIIAAETRVRVRPEIFTYLLLAVTLVLVESVRRGGSPRRLWWLVPINIVWVNLHGLFAVGLAAAWAGVAGAAVDRALARGRDCPLAGRGALLAMIAATAACFVSPWPIKAGLHPLLLWTRLAGHSQLYTYGVDELRPTWTVNPLGNVPLLVTALLALATFAAVGLRRRAAPAGHALWLLMFAAIALLALRNLVLFAVPAGLLLALHGGAALKWLTRRRPPPRAIRGTMIAAMLLLAAAVAAAYATEAVYRWQRRPESQFGLGRAENVQPVAMAQWLETYPADGDVLPLDFGNGGVFMLYTPRRQVWMDGRLEVHSPERFRRQRQTYKRLRSPGRAGDPRQTPLPPSVRFLVVRASDTDHIEALSQRPERFRCLYADPTGACFARLPRPGEKVSFSAAAALPAGNLAGLDRRLRPDLEPLLDVPTRRRWYRQNVLPAHWRMGAVLYSLGLNAPAVRYLAVAERLRLAESGSVRRVLAQSHQRLSEADPIRPARDLPADIHLARALALHRRIDLKALPPAEALSVAMARLRGLLKGNQIDAAAAYLPTLDAFPPEKAASASNVETMKQVVGAYHRLAKAKADAANDEAFTPAERARLLAAAGLIDSAVQTLRSAAGLNRWSQILLGDLRLQQGLTGEARQAYSAAGGDGWEVRMRLGLCDWADGDLAGAAQALRAAVADPAPTAYLALFHEQLGDYPAAAEALRRFKDAGGSPPDARLRQVLDRIAARLEQRGQLVPRWPTEKGDESNY